MSVAQVLTVQRPRLVRIAYRMLGSWNDAEDVVGEVGVDTVRIDHAPDNPVGWLTTITVRRSVDLLRRRKREREHYVGTWLPEPLVSDSEPGPELESDRRAELSIGFLRLAETLTPTQRAVIILRCLGYRHQEVADLLKITISASRQHEHRARRRLRSTTDPVDADRVDDEQQRTVRRLLDSFLQAARRGETAELIKLLHADVVFYSDGGGQVKAARSPVVGPDRVARFLIGINRRSPTAEVRPILVNARSGIVIELGGNLHVVTLEVEQGLITAIYDISNPDKLPVGMISQSGSAASVRPGC